MERWGRDSWSAAIRLSETHGHHTHTHTHTEKIPHYKRPGFYRVKKNKNKYGNGVGTDMII